MSSPAILVGGPEDGHLVFMADTPTLRIARFAGEKWDVDPLYPVTPIVYGTYEWVGWDDPSSDEPISIYEWRGWEDEEPPKKYGLKNCPKCMADMTPRYESDSWLCRDCGIEWASHYLASHGF